MLEFDVSYDIAVNKSTTSYHKICLITRQYKYIDNVRLSNAFSYRNNANFESSESYFEELYDQQNFTLMIVLIFHLGSNSMASFIN